LGPRVTPAMTAVPQTLAAARAGRYAVAAFNVFDLESMMSVLETAANAASPVIVQTSAIVARRLGPGLIAAIFREIATPTPRAVALQLDHCSDLGLISACFEAKWDAVLFDGSTLAPAENARLTAEVVREAHRCGVAVEGELESIGGTETGVRRVIRRRAPVAEMVEFIGSTGIDAFAPSIGNVHGRTTGPAHLDVSCVSELAALTSIPLVLHGGTGVPERVLRALIDAGIAKVNVSTDLRDAYLQSAHGYLTSVGSIADPIALQDEVRGAVSGAVAKHLARVGSSGRAPLPIFAGAGR
jgi:fructose-bisphosphate aldolase, class II